MKYNSQKVVSTFCVQDDGASVLRSPCSDSTKDMWSAPKPQERIYWGEFAWFMLFKKGCSSYCIINKLEFYFLRIPGTFTWLETECNTPALTVITLWEALWLNALKPRSGGLNRRFVKVRLSLCQGGYVSGCIISLLAIYLRNDFTLNDSIKKVGIL